MGQAGGLQARPRADEVSFRMLESPSGLQIANFRCTDSMFADVNAYLGLCGGRAKDLSLLPAHSSSLSPNTNGDGRPRADGKENNLCNGDSKKFDRQCIDNELREAVN